MLRSVLMMSVVVVFAACLDLPGRGAQEATAAQETQSDCQSDGICPKNSPVIATFPFHELSLNLGQANAQGFAIEQVVIGGLGYGLSIVAGRIIAARGNDVREHGRLKGAQLWIRKNTVEYVLRITDVKLVKMWARIGSTLPIPQIEAYVIDWADVINGQPLNEWTNVCAAARLPPADLELLGAPNDVTFVFPGERIDPRTKTIYDLDARWFNLGCAGHTLAKMYLMGHVEVASSLGYVTTIDERQTIMKMFAADYCGTGYSFTMPGVALKWQDHKHWASYPPPLAGLAVEARWTPTGVACLNEPRAMANPTPDTLAKWPGGIVPQIAARCPEVLGLPCNSDIQAFNGYHLVTANPPP